MADWMIVSGVVGLYLALVLAVGLAARRGQESSLEGYATGGRSIGIVVLFFILGAEIFSAFTFLGAPGEAFGSGVPSLYILAYLSLALVMWWFIGPRVAELGRRHGYMTQADLISDRFRSKKLSMLMAAMSVVALIPYLTIQITGAGLLFSFATEGKFPFWLGSLIAFGVVTLYVYVSGLKGIGWTNLLQGVLMLVVAWVIGVSVIVQFFGTPGEMFTQIEAVAPEYLTLPGGGDAWTWGTFSSAIVLSVLGFVMWPHVFMKSYSAGSNRSIKKTITLYPLYALLVVPIILAGLGSIVLLRDDPPARADEALLQVLVYLLNLPPAVVGVILAGAVAAAMSTGANLAHAAGTIFVRDFVQPAAGSRLSDTAAYRWTRLSVVVISALAFVFAVVNVSTIVQLFLLAYGIVIQFLPLTLATLYWRRANLAGAMSGVIGGLLVSIWFTFVQPHPLDIDGALWGLAVNTLLTVVVSIATKPMPAEHTDRFIITADELDEADLALDAEKDALVQAGTSPAAAPAPEASSGTSHPPTARSAAQRPD
ncbi:sodium:solute symporter [Brachybacterium sp. sponge]|uniref:sodium:solute symporter family protein n=1 Tax=Brachybacterium sp. sponge TaxID=1775432 RepID=UPI000AD3051F|nr:sodium:solute symporter family protein [Brachybacterium sp. sponge]